MNISVLTSLGETIEIGEGLLISALAVSFAVIVLFYILRSVGLYVMAKKAQVNNPWIAWIPAVWMYTACMLLGKTKFFGKPVAKIAVILCIAFSIASVVNFVYELLTYIPLLGYCIDGGDIYYVGTGSASNLRLPFKDYPYRSDFFINSETFNDAYSTGVKQFLSVLSWLSWVFSFVKIIIEVFVIFSLFRKYWPNHYLLGSILSVFLGLFGIFVFAVRNNSPVDYAEYMRSKMGYGNFGYGVPHANEQNRDYEQKDDSPFADFDNQDKKSDDPFDEYPDKKDDNK